MQAGVPGLDHNMFKASFRGFQEYHGKPKGNSNNMSIGSPIKIKQGQSNLKQESVRASGANQIPSS